MASTDSETTGLTLRDFATAINKDVRLKSAAWRRGSNQFPGKLPTRYGLL